VFARWQGLSPGVRLALVSAICAAFTALALTATMDRLHYDAEKARANRFGSTLTTELAAMAVEPTIARDPIRLSALATRVSRLNEVDSVSFYSIDNQALATAGKRVDASRPHFTQPIVFEDAVAGYASLALNEPAFASAAPRVWLWLVALAAVAISALVGFLAGRDPRDDDAPVIDADAPAFEDEPHPTEVFLLIVNLFNQISLPSNERQHVLGVCDERLKRVCALYNGRSIDLPGTGLLLAFDDDGDPDRCFGVLCAALLAVEVLEDLNHGHLDDLKPTLVFRFGMHLGPDTKHLVDLIDTDAARDAVVLSGVAANHTVAVSSDLFARLPRAERFVAETRQHPLLGTLSTSHGVECQIVRSLAESYRGLLDRQAALLTGQDPSTSSPSAF
jgi:hypothetical protein